MSTSTPGRASTPVMSHRQIMLVIYGLMAGMFLSALDQTIVGTAIRTIGDDLKGLDQQAWVTTAYLITSTIATPIYGKLSDQFGRRPLYIFGISVFLAGSLLSTFSTSMLMLAGFRALQGIGAGALMSLPLAIMGDMLAPRERAKYQGYFLAVFGISSLIGPLIGGLFAGEKSILWVDGWRWVFLVNVPVGVLALFLVISFLHLPRFSAGPARPRIDWWGATAVIATLVPLLLVAEQGREWGWTSVGSIACYVIGAVGLVSFLVVETVMKDDAIIPLRLFRSGVFSMSTVLGFLVGFGMFGAMLTIPLYLQLVTGLTPTESGFATLPMVGGLMIAAILSGQITSKTGKYRIFPVIGTALTAGGYFLLTLMTVDKPLWFLMIAMFLIGLGLGQLMQTLTMASQNSVEPRDIGVATSASTFFRQMGGTLGTAVLLSVLFTVMPAFVSTSVQDKSTLTTALDAALTPAVANAPENAGVMKQLWKPMVAPLTQGAQNALDDATAQIASRTSDAPATVQAQALAAAADAAGANVVEGRLVLDLDNARARRALVDHAVPAIQEQLRKASSSSSGGTSATSDSSYLNGADERLAAPFKKGFNDAAVIVYWVGLAVILLAFVLSWFFRVPPLRDRSALQEQADDAAELELALG